MVGGHAAAPCWELPEPGAPLAEAMSTSATAESLPAATSKDYAPQPSEPGVTRQMTANQLLSFLAGPTCGLIEPVGSTGFDFLLGRRSVEPLWNQNAPGHMLLVQKPLRR